MNEYLPIFVGDDLPEKGWESGMYCLETDRAKILRSNLLLTSAVLTFPMVLYA